MADGTYRFQQPGAGQFFFQTQAQQHSHQRHIIRNGTGSPTGRLKFNHETPSPSRTPPLGQAAALNTFAMYSQNHQAQHVLMSSGQAHQRFGMQIPKFQTQSHHPHPAQQPHHHAHHNQPPQHVGHQHNFSSGALASATPHFTPSHIQNGTHTNIDEDLDESMNEHWQQQLQLAAESRQASSPHYYARTVAQQTKGIQIVQPEAQENGVNHKNGVAKVKAASRQGWHALDFGGQGLRALSPSLFKYDFLEKLYLNHNKLKVLPPSIGQLRKLTLLDLSGNELTELPEEIGMLTSLKQLSLFDNNIRTLPYEMGYLYRLEILGVEGNPLEDVLKSQIMKEGTKALIRYLKEEMPS
jgi:CCR4-NOT transcription complex subunit 6